MMFATDASALRALWRATWLETYGPVLGPDRLGSIEDALSEDAASRMTAADGGGFVCAVDGGIVGSVCFAERHAIGHVWGMDVHPLHQRRGIGSALLRRAAGEMAGAATLDLMTVTPSAEGFYRRLGFRVVGTSEVEVFPGVTLPATRLGAHAATLRAGVTPPA